MGDSHYLECVFDWSKGSQDWLYFEIYPNILAFTGRPTIRILRDTVINRNCKGHFVVILNKRGYT